MFARYKTFAAQIGEFERFGRLLHDIRGSQVILSSVIRGGLGVVNCAFFVSGFFAFFFIDSCKALLIIYVKRRYIKWKINYY